MKNPFNQPAFVITDTYIQRSLEAATFPLTVYTGLTGKELPGELYVLVAQKSKFRDAQQALISLMQRMLVLLVSEIDEFSTYDEEAITGLTMNFCLAGWYNELEYEEIPGDYFMKEAAFLFQVFKDHFDRDLNKEDLFENNVPYGFFKNDQPVEGFEKINPIQDEIILQSYSLVNYSDGQYFFAISEENYILLNWQSGGPMHLLVKPSKRNPGSLLLSKDAFKEALSGNNKEQE